MSTDMGIVIPMLVVYDSPVNEVADNGTAPFHCRLLPGNNHIVFISIMTTYIKRSNRNPLLLHISI